MAEWTTVSLRFTGERKPTPDQLARLDAALRAADPLAPSLLRGAKGVAAGSRRRHGFALDKADWPDASITPEQLAALLHREGWPCEYRSWAANAHLNSGWREPGWSSSGLPVRVPRALLHRWEQAMRPPDLAGEVVIGGGDAMTLFAEMLRATGGRT